MASSLTTSNSGKPERRLRNSRRVSSEGTGARRLDDSSTPQDAGAETGKRNSSETTTAGRIKMATKILVDLKSGLLEDLNYNNLGTSYGETVSPTDNDNQAGKLSAMGFRSGEESRSYGLGTGSTIGLGNKGRAGRSRDLVLGSSGSSSSVAPNSRDENMFMKDYPLWDFIPKDMQHPVPLITRSARLRAERVRIYLDVFYNNIEKNILNDTISVENSESNVDLTSAQERVTDKSSSNDRNVERVFHAGVEGVYNPLQVIRNRKLRKKYHEETKMERVPFFRPPIIAVLEFSKIPNRKKYRWYVSMAEKYIDLSWRVAHWDELVDPQGHLWSHHQNYYQHGTLSQPQSPGEVLSPKRRHLSPNRLHYHHHHHHHRDHDHDHDHNHDRDNDGNNQRQHYQQHSHRHLYVHNLSFRGNKGADQNSESGSSDNIKNTKETDNVHLEVPNRYSPNVEKYISPGSSEDEHKPRVKTLDRILNRAKKGISRSSGSTSSFIAESEGVQTTRTTGNNSLGSNDSERKKRSVVGSLRNAAPNLLSPRAIRNFMTSRNSYVSEYSSGGRRMSVYEPFDGPTVDTMGVSTEDDLDMEEEDEIEESGEDPLKNSDSPYSQNVKLKRKVSRVRSRIEKSISEELNIPIIPARKNDKTKEFKIGLGTSPGGIIGEEDEDEDIRDGYRSDVDNYNNTNDDDDKEGGSGKDTNRLDPALLGRLNVNSGKGGELNKVPVDAQLQQYWQDIRNVRNTIALLKHRRKTNEIVEKRALAARNTIELDHNADVNIEKTRNVIETYNSELDRVLKIGNSWANKLLNDYTIRVESLISSSDRILSDINTTLTLKLKLFQENTDRYDSIRTMQSQKTAKILYKALEFLIVLILWSVWLIVNIFREVRNGILLVIKFIRWMVW